MTTPSELPAETSIPNPQTLPIKTHHCRFCATLLLATTRSYEFLPRRQMNALDSAIILPLRNHSLPNTNPSSNSDEPEGKEESEGQTHYTILLSSSTRDRKPTLIRREDGFEKRVFLKCGRCRVTVGYFLDGVHFPVEKSAVSVSGTDSGREEEDRVVYLLPGALMETEIMSDEEKIKALDREWESWFKQ
ncbi:uncharacterized protein BDV17DRAFT_292746 [Aspergillus undulatus]|uniref:uncharacterized protein n=1 Tax=Aspergillus undulatus TaxID=1810928 RepID=UPI003CCD00D4